MIINTPTFLITIDVEDWFQVENFKNYIPFTSWSNYQLRVERNVHCLLELFDSVETGGSKSETVSQTYENSLKNSTSIGSNLQQATNNENSKKVRTTFFVLGWIAERLPGLVREIFDRGHEIASHGYSHNLCSKCSRDELQKDLSESKKLLEDITGSVVNGYRAPSFSIDNDTLKIIEAGGYLFDSSYNSFELHSRYGSVDIPHPMKKKGLHSEFQMHFMNSRSAISISKMFYTQFFQPKCNGKRLLI